MRIKFIMITSGLLLLLTTVKAQKVDWSEAGIWKERSATWVYNLGKDTGNAGDKFKSGEQAKISVASTATPGSCHILLLASLWFHPQQMPEAHLRLWVKAMKLS